MHEDHLRRLALLVERLQREAHGLRAQLGELGGLASTGRRGANGVTELANDSLRRIGQRLQRLECTGASRQ